MPISNKMGWSKMFTKITVLLLLLFLCSADAKEKHNADYYFMLGEKSLLDEDLQGAKSNFEKAAQLEKENNSSFLHMRLSETHELSGEHDIAIEELNRALELDPDNISARMMYIELMITEKEFQRALDNCEHVLRLEPDNMDATSYKVAMLIKLNRDNEAEALLQQYKTRNPHDEFPYFYAGIIYQLENNNTMAENKYKSALLINPSYEPAISGLVVLYKKNRDKDLAIRKLEELSIKIPELKDEVIKLSIIEGEKQKDQTKAQLHYNKALKHIDEQLKANPSEYSKLIQKAMVLEEAGNIQGTLRTLEGALKYHPDNERILYYLAVVNDKIGHRKKALELMEKVISIDPENPEALNYVAYSYVEGSPEKLIEAEALIKKALDIMPDSYYIMDSMGWLLYKKGDLKRSKKFLESALKTAISERTFEHEIIDHLIALYNRTSDNKGLEALQNTLLELLNSDDYNDNKAEIEKILERINGSADKNK